jgi:hypothetical protein
VVELSYNIRPRYEALAGTQLIVTVKETNITTATGQVTIYPESAIYEDKFAGGLDGVCVKVDGFGNTLEESTLTAGGAIISVISIDSNGNYQLSGTPASSAAIRYLLLTTIEGLQHIPVDVREPLRFYGDSTIGTIKEFEWIEAGVDKNIKKSRYLERIGNSVSNEVQFLVPFDGEISMIKVESQQVGTWIAEVHRNNTLITGATLQLTNEQYKKADYNISVSEGDLLSLYANTTNKIYEPHIKVLIIKT